MATTSTGLPLDVSLQLPREPRVFVSYRREDASGAAGMISAHLRHQFGTERVFLDTDNIPLGADFLAIVEEAIRACDALIVLIGKSWLAAADSKGQSRLFDPGDAVRLEIMTALAHDLCVIPVLVQGAAMPASHELPLVLSSLAHLHTVAIRDNHFKSDMQRLEASLRTLLRYSLARDVEAAGRG